MAIAAYKWPVSWQPPSADRLSLRTQSELSHMTVPKMIAL